MQADLVAVIGAGQMGTGIGYAFAAAGCAVVVIDPSAMALSRACEAVAELVRGAVKRALLTQEEGDGVLARLIFRGDLREGLGEARLLVETATEDLGVKQGIFRSVEALAGPETILATNTSALSITEIASALKAPERLVGMHFFNPVHKMRLVELVRGLMTSADAVDGARRWVDRIGKTSIVVNEAPGFVTSRMSALMGNEAMYMLSEGVASAEDIDISLRLAFNYPMGPLELGDLTGWDTRLAVLEYLHRAFGEKFRPCPLIHKMVKAGRHGRKTGIGVYRYDSAGHRVPGSGLKVP